MLQLRTKIILTPLLFFGLFLSAQYSFIDVADTKVAQIINDTAVLARIRHNGTWSQQLICVTEIPTENLVDGARLLANAQEEILLVADGTYTYSSVLNANRKVRKFVWPDPERIKVENRTVTKTETEQCDNCKGEGRLEKTHKGQLGRKICPVCDGKKIIKKKVKNEVVRVWLDDKRVK